MSHADPFTAADVAAVIQAARHIGAGGVGPLPVLSEHLSRIANKMADRLMDAAFAKLDAAEAVPNTAAVAAVDVQRDGFHITTFTVDTDRAEAEADV